MGWKIYKNNNQGLNVWFQGSKLSFFLQANAVQRLASLPLFDSALKSVVSVYTDVKGRYPLLGVVGGVAEIGVRNVSQAAILRATPLLLSLEPQSESTEYWKLYWLILPYCLITLICHQI